MASVTSPFSLTLPPVLGPVAAGASARAAEDAHVGEPSPYDMYIRLAELTTAWAGAADARGGSPAVAASVADALTEALAADSEADRRPHVDCEERTARIRSLRRSGRTLAALLPALLPDGDPVPRTPMGGPTAPGANHEAEQAATDSVIAQLRAAVPAGPEDHMFRTAHQVTECWLHVAHTCAAAGVQAAGRGNWETAARQLDVAARAVGLAITAGQLLDLMDLADYHPLRVLLRDGSGAQSLAARALPRSVRAAATALTSSLERDGRTLVELLARAVPGTVPVVAGTPAELGYVRSLRLLSKRCQEFLFQHYLLVLEVLGADNTGSLGYAVATMAHRAAQPLVPELNRALHDFAKATDLQHATRAGVMILENERRAGWDPAPPEPGEQMQTEWADEVVASYFAALADRDTERWTELFHPAGHLVGQSGTRPFIGRPRLKVFMDSMLCQFTALQPEVTTVVRTGPASFRAVWSISAVHYTGPEVTLRGAEELLLAADGLIVSAISDWNAAQVAAQLWPGAPAMPSPNPASFDGQRQSNGPAERWDAAVA